MYNPMVVYIPAYKKKLTARIFPYIFFSPGITLK